LIYIYIILIKFLSIKVFFILSVFFLIVFYYLLYYVYFLIKYKLYTLLPPVEETMLLSHDDKLTIALSSPKDKKHTQKSLNNNKKKINQVILQ